MNGLQEKGGKKSGTICDWRLHKHSSYDAVAHEFDKFFLTDREPMKDPY